MCVFFLQAFLEVCALFTLGDLKKKNNNNVFGELMHVMAPGSLGEEHVLLGRCTWGLSYPLSAPHPLPQHCTDKGANRHTGCGFSWSDDSFQLTKDSGQGSEKSG